MSSVVISHLISGSQCGAHAWSTSLGQMTKGVSTEVDGLASLIVDDFRDKSGGTCPFHPPPPTTLYLIFILLPPPETSSKKSVVSP